MHRAARDPERYFCVHLQTGGTSLRTRVGRHFGPEEIYPRADELTVEGVIIVDYLERRWRERRDTLRFVAGHFPLCATEVLGGGFTTLTLLRDPVERTLSYLRHHAKSTPTDAFRRRIEADNALDVELYAFARELVARRSAPR